MNLHSLRHLAKEILALATLELFPGTTLIGGDVDEIGFYYDFLFPKETLTDFSDRELRHFEDRMIQIIHEKRPIKELEMMRENAATLLNHLSQTERAQAALAQEMNIISLIEIGSFRDLCSGPFPEDTGVLKAFKLQGYKTDQGVVRVFGTAFFEKNDLKTFLKQYKEAAKRDPLVIGPKEGYFIPLDGEWIYLDKGMRILQKLKDFWEKEHADFEHIAFSDALDPREVHASLDRKKIASLSLFSRDWVSIKCADEAELAQARISSLQFMEKAFKIFPFDRRIRAVEHEGPTERIEFRARDGYGREKTLAYIEVERKKNVLHRSLFYSPKVWVALTVEMGVKI